MTGIDGESAHLQMVRAQVMRWSRLTRSRNSKKTITAKNFSAADELKAFASELLGGRSQLAFA